MGNWLAILQDWIAKSTPNDLWLGKGGAVQLPYG